MEKVIGFVIKDRSVRNENEFNWLVCKEWLRNGKIYLIAVKKLKRKMENYLNSS